MYIRKEEVDVSAAITYHSIMKKRKEVIYQYEVIFDPNGSGYTITVPKLPGLVTEGGSLREAREMAKDAIRCYLQALLKEKASYLSRSAVHRAHIKVSV